MKYQFYVLDSELVDAISTCVDRVHDPDSTCLVYYHWESDSKQWRKAVRPCDFNIDLSSFRSSVFWICSIDLASQCPEMSLREDDGILAAGGGLRVYQDGRRKGSFDLGGMISFEEGKAKPSEFVTSQRRLFQCLRKSLKDCAQYETLVRADQDRFQIQKGIFASQRCADAIREGTLESKIRIGNRIG